MANCLGETSLHLAVPGLRLAAKGKVRDVYESGEHLVLVTTDRQSAFDRVLASIPFKGQVYTPYLSLFSANVDKRLFSFHVDDILVIGCTAWIFSPCCCFMQLQYLPVMVCK
jgi:phosphoribosylaminoimidazole-succinocarboxamide synthase